MSPFMPLAHYDPKSRPIDSQDSGATAQEMPSIIICMEAYQIAVKDTQEQFLSYGQNPVDFATGKWRVQEKANLNVFLRCANLFSQHLWQEHEMIVVDPDQISILDILRHDLCKLSVDLYVCIPSGLVEGDLSWVVME